MPTSRPTVNKSVFGASRECAAKGWFTKHVRPSRPLDAGARMRSEQGNLVGARARLLFPDGILISTSTRQDEVAETARLMNDGQVQTLFEPCFKAGDFIARADILTREDDGWHLIEVKSGTQLKTEYIQDVAYTAMVARLTNIRLARVSLMILNKEYLLGDPLDSQFATLDVTAEVETLIPEFRAMMDGLPEILCRDSPPDATISPVCRNCEFFQSDCVGKEIIHPIFDLPRITKQQCGALLRSGWKSILDVSSSRLINQMQKDVLKSVKKGKMVVNGARLRELLGQVEWPVYYLDFESLTVAMPFYPEVRPYEQVLTQYSLHVFAGPGEQQRHSEYLADPARDCREELAEVLLRDLEEKGSVVVYSHFEKTILEALAIRFPGIADRVEAVLARLFDLRQVFGSAIYHPEFRGSESIKYTLPALTDMTYEDLNLKNGQEAVAAFLELANGGLEHEVFQQLRKDLLDYCARDTLAMVRLHHVAMDILERHS